MLPLFAQEHSTGCVAACVRMVMADLGLSLTESEIRLRCGHSGLGMRLNQIAAGLTDFPVKIEYHTNWSLDDIADAIRQSIFPIVGVDLRYIEGLFAFHSIVVANVTKEQIVVHDPLHPQSSRVIGSQTFEEAWESADSECLVISLKQKV